MLKFIQCTFESYSLKIRLMSNFLNFTFKVEVPWIFMLRLCSCCGYKRILPPAPSSCSRSAPKYQFQHHFPYKTAKVLKLHQKLAIFGNDGLLTMTTDRDTGRPLTMVNDGVDTKSSWRTRPRNTVFFRRWCVCNYLDVVWVSISVFCFVVSMAAMISDGIFIGGRWFAQTTISYCPAWVIGWMGYEKKAGTVSWGCRGACEKCGWGLSGGRWSSWWVHKFVYWFFFLVLLARFVKCRIGLVF